MKLPRRDRPSTGRSVVVVHVAGRRVALPATKLARVAWLDAVVPLPGDLACNLGLVQHLGVVVALVDLAFLLDLRPPRLPEPPFPCVFARLPRGLAGFPVDRLEGLRLLHGESPELEILDVDDLEARLR